MISKLDEVKMVQQGRKESDVWNNRTRTPEI